VAGGNKQQDYISKEDASSPTVATEAVLLSCIIDAEEERDVAIINIPNAFIQTRVEDEEDMAIIKIHGILVDILVQIAPDSELGTWQSVGCESYCTRPNLQSRLGCRVLDPQLETRNILLFASHKEAPNASCNAVTPIITRQQCLNLDSQMEWSLQEL
jgi:hypothetical protein